MVEMAKKTRSQESGLDPLIGFPEALVVNPWEKAEAAPGEGPPRKEEPVFGALPTDRNDYPEYYLG